MISKSVVNMMSFLMVFLLFSCVPSENKNPSSNIYKANIGNYSFIAFSEPQYSKHTTGNLTSHMHSYDYKDFFYQTAYFELDQSMIGKEDISLRNMLGGLARDPGAFIVSEADISYLGHPGKEALISTPDGLSVTVKLFIIDGERVYKFMVINDGSKNLMIDEVKYFMNTIFIHDVEVMGPSQEGDQELYLGQNLELSDLHQLLYLNNNYSDELLTNGSWERAGEFDVLVTVQGNEYHTYNYIYPNEEEGVNLIICPFVNIYYQADTSTFRNLFRQIALSKTLIEDRTDMGFRILAFMDDEDRYLLFLNYGPDLIQIWRGLTGTEHMAPIDKEYILNEFGFQ